MTRPHRVAAIQMVSSAVVADNLAAAGALIAQAVDDGAELVALPEYFCILGNHERDKLAVREALAEGGRGGGPIQAWLAETARRHRIWIVGGTVPIDCGSDDKILNTSLVYDPAGACVARYDKIHLFGFHRRHEDGTVEQFDEARTIAHGTNGPTVVDTPLGRLGLSVCYDVRFPELYRGMDDVDLILVPSAFTATTGKAHWEPLLRARAIENLAYVLAPAQGGRHANGRTTHGHSMFVDPWGEVRGVLPVGPGVVAGDLDRERLRECRGSLPALAHRRLA
ncbi:MAG: carbon-nitrogen hydrolase family protein [Burkholderiales bacterium]|nr:carbon-nitrogen hydrolase family protein [Burkholderiales bacterium]